MVRAGRRPTRIIASPTTRGGVSRRHWRPLIVGGALLLALGATTGLLSLISPSPLSPDVSGSLFAAGVAPSSPAASPFETLYRRSEPVRAGRWSVIYVRHSKTPAGNASTLADAAHARGIVGPPDHFVIGNGLGMGDGELQFTPRWDKQEPAAPPAAGTRTEPDCISICLIGDFDQAPPTPAQQSCVAQLLASLQARLAIPAEQVIRLRDLNSPAGVGRLYPD